MSAVTPIRNDTDERRLPPHDLDAEMSVLGAMMMQASVIGDVIEVISAGDFYRESHGTIFKAALTLYAKGLPVEPTTLADKLAETQELDAAGGKGKLVEIASFPTAASNAIHHARIVRDQSTLRRLIRAGSEIARLGHERGSETATLVSQAERLVFEIGEATSTGELEIIKETLVETFARINELYENGAEVTGVPSGFRDLDQIPAGFQRSNLVILAARPSMGKSALGLSIVANVVREGIPAAFFSLEMSNQEIAQRLMCMESKVDSQHIRTGKLKPDDWPRLAKACADLEKVPLYIDDTPGLTLLELRSRAQTLKRREPRLGLVVVDYLQLMTAGGNVESRLQEVSSISRGLKALAKDLDVPILALSQLSRAVEQRHDKRPILSDLRESGGIEQDADLVMFIYRDEYYNKEESEDQGMAEVHVAKHRNGPTDTIKLAFLSRYAKFVSAHG